MSDRVVFIPLGVAVPFAFSELGRGTAGAWGVVEDGPWLAAGGAGDPLELLYLSPVEYHHAVRGLPPDEVAAVVERRRDTFARQLPSLAMGLVELQVRGCFALFGDNERERQACADLLVALASFTTVPRFSAIAPAALLDLLREGDAKIIAELNSPSLRAAGDLDPAGDERATRRRFATETGALLARRGDPDAGRALPYFDVERVYLITPVPEELEAAAHTLHDPVERFGGGLLLPLPEREAGPLAAQGHQMQVAFPTRGQFMGAASALTAAQVSIELDALLRAPAFVAYLAALRVQQATLRAAVHLIAGADAELAPLLARQRSDEAAGLPRWLSAGAPPAPAGTTARDRLGDALGTATFLIGLCRQRGELARTGGLEALTRALSHVAGDLEG